VIYVGDMKPHAKKCKVYSDSAYLSCVVFFGQLYACAI